MPAGFMYIVLEGRNVLTSADNGYTEWVPVVAMEDEHEAERLRQQFTQGRVVEVPMMKTAVDFAPMRERQKRWEAWRAIPPETRELLGIPEP